MPSAGQARNWDKAQWTDALGRSTDNPRMKYCENQNGTIIHIRAVHGHSHGVTINPTLFCLEEILVCWKEHMFHPPTNQS